jgi:AraC-like DNA-binding protein
MNDARSGPARTPIPATYARALLRRFGQTPARRAELLDHTGLDEAALNAPGAEPPLHSVLELAARITRAEGEAWPLDAKAAWSNAMQGALDVAVRSAATFEDALSALARYGHIRAPYLSIRLHTSRTRRRLVLKPAVVIEAALWRAIALAVALSVREMLTQILEDPWAAPIHAARMREALTCTVKFERRDFAMEFPAQLGRRGSPFADASLHASAVAELDDAARRRAGDGSIVRKLERLILLHLPRRLGEPEAATLLGLSRRTLVRRHAQANLSFRSLVDEVLRSRAEAMRAGGKLSREDMAAALGYADPTSFSRARRRWSSFRSADHQHM